MRQAEPLAGAGHGGEQLARVLGGVADLGWFEAVVAVAAAPGVFFAEVGEQSLGPAAGGVAVLDDLFELVAGVLLLGGVFLLLDEVLDLAAVAAGVEEDAVRGQAVAAGAAGLLVEALDVAGQVGVKHEADVGLVHAHAKGNGGAHHPRVAENKGVLVGLAHLGRQAGVVGQRGDARRFEPVGDLLAAFTRLAVHDALRQRVALQVGEDLLDDALLGADLVVEVGAFKAAAVLRGVAEGQLADDVLGDARRRGGGEGHDRHLAEPAVKAGTELAEHAVLGPKVVAPLADAVGLVDGEAGDVELGQQGAAGGGHQPLGGEVQQAVLTRQGVLLAAVELFAVEGGIEEGRRDAVGLQQVYLVLHQGDERGDHDGRAARLGEGGQLVAEALAPAGGEDHEHVAAREGVVDDRPLHRAKRLVPEVLLEQRPQRVGRTARDRVGPGSLAAGRREPRR